MKFKVNIVTFVTLTLLLIGWFLNMASIYILFAVAVIYVIINIMGSIKIEWNYFLFSHCKGESSLKEIALTFDDGPHPSITPDLLKLLAKYNVNATFFCLGKNVESYPEIARSIINNNNIIGNHSYFHSYYFDLLSSSQMEKEITQTNAIIYKNCKIKPKLFRPPYGVTNPMLKKAIEKSGLTSIGWSLRSFDTSKSTELVKKRLKKNTKPGDIVLLHDTVDDAIAIIEDYLIWLKDAGYKIVSLDQLLKIKSYED